MIIRISDNKVITDRILCSWIRCKRKAWLDVYEDNTLENNTKSMAYSLQFQSSDRTLTSKEIDKEITLIIKNLQTKLEAKQR